MARSTEKISIINKLNLGEDDMETKNKIVQQHNELLHLLKGYYTYTRLQENEYKERKEKTKLEKTTERDQKIVRLREQKLREAIDMEERARIVKRDNQQMILCRRV